MNADFYEALYYTARNMIIILLIALMLGIMGTLAEGPIYCEEATDSMSFDHRWDLLDGCQIRTEANGWIRLKVYTGDR